MMKMMNTRFHGKEPTHIKSEVMIMNIKYFSVIEFIRANTRIAQLCNFPLSELSNSEIAEIKDYINQFFDNQYDNETGFCKGGDFYG